MRKSGGGWLAGILVVGMIAAFSLPVAAGAMAARSGPLAHPIAHGVTSVSSTNWAGYAVTGARGSVTDVKGSWIVPAIVGSCPSTNQYSSFWVGIDGYSSNSVEQTGTDSDCQGGSAVYYAWYEFYPNPSHLISGLTVSAGDTMFAEVKFANKTFTVTITDVTTGKSSSHTSNSKAARSSAEWIAEAPSSFSGILPLADFGKVQFGKDATSVASTCMATLGGSTHAIGGFTNVHAITMVKLAGTANKATPSALTPDHTSFNVTWNSAGP